MENEANVVIYINLLGEAKDALDALTAYINAHGNVADPDDVTRADVDKLSTLVGALGAATLYMRPKDN